MTRTAHQFKDPALGALADLARRSGASMRTAAPASTGIGSPSAAGAAPASLDRSPGAAGPTAQQAKIPFTRASSLACMQDKTVTGLAAGVPTTVSLLTNAFLAYIILDVNIVAVNVTTAVKWATDGPWNIFGSAGIQLTDPSNQAIFTAISGFKLAQLNKYLSDTGCNFDPARDSGFYMLPTAANNATGSTATNAGSAYFRLVIPVENRRRDAFGALTNSAANEQMHLILTPAASLAGGTDFENSVYATAPATSVTLNVRIWQMYWTAPPAVIVSGGQGVQAARTPAGLGTVGYVRSERHNEVSGGGSAPFQLTSVGEVISNIVWTLRTTTSTNSRDAYTAGSAFDAGYANWPATFNFAVNDFTLLSLGQDLWIREMSRFYNLTNGISAQAGNPGYLDAGVFTFGPYINSLFDKNENFSLANQNLATEAGTKLQVRDSVWGSASSFVEVDVRVISPESGASLYN